MDLLITRKLEAVQIQILRLHMQHVVPRIYFSRPLFQIADGIKNFDGEL